MADKAKAAVKATEPRYSLGEIAQAAPKFGTRGYVVRAAFRLAGKSESTRAEAERLINEYRQRKIKERD